MLSSAASVLNWACLGSKELQTVNIIALDAMQARSKNVGGKPCNARMRHVKGNKAEAENHAMRECSKQRENHKKMGALS